MIFQMRSRQQTERRPEYLSDNDSEDGRIQSRHFDLTSRLISITQKRFQICRAFLKTTHVYGHYSYRLDYCGPSKTLCPGSKNINKYNKKSRLTSVCVWMFVFESVDVEVSCVIWLLEFYTQYESQCAYGFMDPTVAAEVRNSWVLKSESVSANRRLLCSVNVSALRNCGSCSSLIDRSLTSEAQWERHRSQNAKLWFILFVNL
jgi:hypothetical protein